jgi:hypothetical protein
VADLVPSDDPDLFDFGADIGEFFLKAAGEVVRDYCGWHIAPPQTDTATVPIGSYGYLVLPSTHITAVASVTVDDQVLGEGDYLWDPRGWIELCRRWCHDEKATVSFTHGYDTCPLAVKSVVLEVANTATQTPGGNASEVASPGYRILFEADSQGTVLLPSHRDRLAKYKVGRFA